MSFSDFKKSDLDFDSLINPAKPQKKYPKSSEGLRFLTRNLKNDSSKRLDIQKSETLADIPPATAAPSPSVSVVPSETPNTVVDSSIDIITTAASLNQPIAIDVANSSIDVINTETLLDGVAKSSIDETATTTRDPIIVAETSIDNITTHSSIASNPINFSGRPQSDDTVLNAQDCSLLNEFVSLMSEPCTAPDLSLFGISVIAQFDALYSFDSSKFILRVAKMSIDVFSTPISNPTVAKSSIDENATISALHEPSFAVADLSIDVSTTPVARTIQTESVAITSIVKNTTPATRPSIKIPSKEDRLNFKNNFTKVSHHVLSSFKLLQKSESLVYLYLYRQSYGWNRNTTQATSIRHIANQLHLSTRTVQDAIKALAEKNFISLEEASGYRINILTENGAVSEVPKNNYLTLDNNFFALPEEVSITERLVYFYLYRYSFGFGRRSTEALIKTKDISICLNISIRRLQDALRALLSRGLIQRNSEISSLGFVFSLKLPHEIYPELAVTECVADSSIDRITTTEKTSTDDTATKPEAKTSIVKNTTEDFPVNLQGLDRHVANPSIDVSATNKDIYSKTVLKKTSSGVDDEILNFISEQTKPHPQFSFPISRKKILELLGRHQAEHLKTTFSKLLASLMREGVENPVGMYLHAVEDPESYAVLQKPSTQELADKKRFENQIELREKSFADEVKRIIDSKQESFWNELDERIREEAIAKRRAEMGQGGELKIPEVAIKRSAIERTFWERHHQAWESLPESERTARAGTVKQSIIKRVYAGEGRELPEPLPEREFLKSVDEYAEKLAMISVGKGSNT